MSEQTSLGVCEHCQQQFGYWLAHCGFGDCVYAYCDSCGRTAILSLWDKRMPELPNCPGQQEMCAPMEQYVKGCECGGSFKRGESPRCPHCNRRLSADHAASYIEANAPGTKKGWHWQRNWSEPYCIVVENKRVDNNFRQLIQRSIPATTKAPAASASSRSGVTVLRISVNERPD